MALAFAAEAVLAVGGLAWIRWRDLPVSLGATGDGLAIGTGIALGLAAINLCLLRVGPNVWPLRNIRQLYRDVLEPLFGPLGWFEIVMVSLAAGVAEELFFRGAVQAEWGLAVASILFGLVHIGGIDMIAFGVWAATIGALLGGVAIATDGVLAPMVAHAVYDALALGYIRRSWIARATSDASHPR